MGSLLDQLQSDVKSAMKARDSGRVQTLRMFVNALQTEAKAKLRDLDTAEEVQVLQREKKRRLEAAAAFDDAGSAERASQERSQAALLDGYLPQQLSEAELDNLVNEAIAEVGASGPRDLGAVMKAVMPRVAGRADGAAISGAVRRKLTPGG